MRTKYIGAKIFGPFLAFLFFGLLSLAFGCGHRTDQAMVHLEHGLHAGSAAVDVAVDAVIAKCEEKNLPTKEERLACLGDVKATSDLTEKAMALAVTGLRIYWSARASNNPEEMLKAVALIRDALEILPPQYFQGLKKALR